MHRKVIQELKFCWFLSKIRRARLRLYVDRRILYIRQNSLGVFFRFSLLSVHAKYFCRIWKRTCLNKKNHSKTTPCTLKDFSRHLQIRLNIFGVISDFDKTILSYSRNFMHREVRIRWGKFALSAVSDVFKGTEFWKKSNTWYYILAQEERLATFIFWNLYKKDCSLCICRIF
jgi:hypothetical protein